MRCLKKPTRWAESELPHMATFEVEPEWREATAEAALTPYLLTRYFGLRSFSTLYGFSWTAYAIAGAIGPLLMGMAFDVTGSYTLLLVVLAGGTFVSALLYLCLPRYPEF